MKPWCRPRLKGAILRRQAHIRVANLLTVALDTDLETALYPWELSYSPIWLWVCHQLTWEESCPLICQVIGIQTLIPAEDPESSPVPHGHSPKAPGGKPAKLRLCILEGSYNGAPVCPNHCHQRVLLVQGPSNRNSCLCFWRSWKGLCLVPAPSQPKFVSSTEGPAS